MVTSVPDDLAPRFDIASRFERLPFTRYQTVLVLIIATAYAFDGAELAVMTFTLAPLKTAFGISSVQAGLLASVTYAGMAVGALFAGILSDRFGRRSVMCYSMYVWGAASLLAALSWNFASLALFRGITGLGMGAELPVAFAMLSELLPTALRGRLLGITNVALAVGYLVCGGASFIFFSTTGWRGVFVFMAVMSLFGILVRRKMPESPRWLESRGRHADADATMTRLEAEVQAQYGKPLPEPQARYALEIREQTENPLRMLLRPRYRSRTMLAWTLWFLSIMAAYGIITWTAALLVERGVSVLNSVGLVMFIYLWQIPGTFVSAWLLDTLGRKPVFIASLLLYAVSAVMYVGLSSSIVLVIVFGAMLQFFTSWYTAAIYTYTPELFPTGARATGTGTASSWGRVGAIIGPVVVPLIVPLGGYVGAFAFLAGLLVVAAILLLVFGPETRGRELEEVSE